METTGKLQGSTVPNALLAPLQARSGEEAIDELLLALSHAQQIPEAFAPVRPVAPDHLTISGRIALALVRIPGLDRVVVALGISPAGVRFRGEPGNGVGVVLLTAWGTSAVAELPRHRDALLHLAKDPAFRRAILSASSPQEAAACFPSAPAGHYRTVFTQHYAPLVPELIYVTD